MLFVNGIASPALRGWPQYTGWAGGRRLRYAFDALVNVLRAHSGDYAIDMDNVLVYACSANVQPGLPFVMSSARSYIKGAVIYYGYAIVPEFRLDLPIFLARTAWDSAGPHRALDQMAGRAHAANAPWTIANIPGHHGFEVVDDSPSTRDAIARTLGFLQRAAAPESQRDIRLSLAASRAAAAFMAADWHAAAEAYRALAAERPIHAEAHRQLGEALLRSTDYAATLASLERASELRSMNAGLIAYSAALCNVKLGRYDQAFVWLAKLPNVTGIMQRLRDDRDFDALRADAPFPAGAR